MRRFGFGNLAGNTVTKAFQAASQHGWAQLEQGRRNDVPIGSFSEGNPMAPFLAALFLLLPVPQNGSGKVRIVLIGDSITQGRKAKGDRAMTYSWRCPLWKKLVDAGASFDFVGSLKIGFEGDADWKDYKGKSFDRDHEGHWGWKTRDIRAKLGGWLGGYTPDIALILLGSNDPGGKMTSDETKAEMQKIIELLRKRNPKVTVLLAPPFHEWKPFPEVRTKYRDLARELNTKASGVEYVDLGTGWVSNPKADGTHTVDWVHPNPKGDEKLAAGWFEALVPHLRKRRALR